MSFSMCICLSSANFVVACRVFGDISVFISLPILVL